MPTQFIQHLNKTESGFHILMILSLADGSMQKSESSVILQFLEKSFHESIDLIRQQAFLRALPEEERLNHMNEVAQQFFRISTADERNQLIGFAMKVVMADRNMDKEENAYINALYDCWGLE